MNKYMVKATVQIIVGLVLVLSVSFATAAILNFFQPTAMQVVFGLVAVMLLYTMFNLIKIQASILESRDRLKE